MVLIDCPIIEESDHSNTRDRSTVHRGESLIILYIAYLCLEDVWLHLPVYYTVYR